MRVKTASSASGKRKAHHARPGARTYAFEGAVFRALRQQKGIGLRCLASVVGVSPAYLSNVERGKVASPSEERLRLIARELGQDPDQMLRARATKFDMKWLDPATRGTRFREARAFREQKGIGLRELAGRIGVSPSYLSNVERGKFPPPSEEKLLLMARELGQDPDEWLAKAGKMSSDLPKIIEKHPRQYSALIRSLRNLSENDFRVVVNGLAQQFDVILTNPPYAAPEEQVHAKPPIDWNLLKQTFSASK